jgi:hypothetical protein
VYDVPQDKPLKVALVELDVPTELPLRYSPYPATPTLSVEAAQLTLTDDCDDPVPDNPDGADGACPSAHPAVVVETDAFEDRLPDPSKASTAMM